MLLECSRCHGSGEVGEIKVVHLFRHWWPFGTKPCPVCKGRGIRDLRAETPGPVPEPASRPKTQERCGETTSRPHFEGSQQDEQVRNSYDRLQSFGYRRITSLKRRPYGPVLLEPPKDDSCVKVLVPRDVFLSMQAERAEPWSCPRCPQLNPPSARFCRRCGVDTQWRGLD